MEQAYIIIVKFISSSAVLVFLYLLLFKGKASFKACRRYLLWLIPVAALCSVFTFGVYPSKEVVSSTTVLFVPQNIDATQNSNIVSSPSINYAATTGTITSKEAIVTPKSASWKDKIIDTLNISIVVYILYIIGVIMFVVLLTHQILSLRKIRRSAEKEHLLGSTVYRSTKIETPFSFHNSIYIPSEVQGSRLSVMVMHEQSHIAMNHHIDKEICNIFVILFWFNPVVWYLRKELEAVHEYQCDDFVLECGVDESEYKNYLFDEITGKIPYIVNGFNNSLIKKRFIMMKNPIEVRLRKLRAILTIPVVAILFMAMSFTEAPTPSPKKNSKTETNSRKRTNKTFKNVNDSIYSKKDDATQANIVKTLTNSYNTEITSKSFDDKNLNTTYIYENGEKTSITKSPDNKYTKTVSTDKDGQETVMIKKIDDNKNISTFIKNEKKTTQTITTLNDGTVIKTVNTVDKDGKLIYSNRSAIKPNEIKVDALTASTANMALNAAAATESATAKVAEKKPDAETPWHENPLCYNVKPEQVTILSPTNTNNSNRHIYSIESTKKDCRVTIKMYINGDKWWAYPSSSTMLTDKRGNRYMIRGLADNLPLDKALVFNNLKGTFVGITLIFPPLEEGIDTISLTNDNYRPEFLKAQSNSWNAYNLKIANYSNPASKGKIYK